MKAKNVSLSKLAVDLDLTVLSIYKWIGIVFEGKTDYTTTDCPLCNKYHPSPFFKARVMKYIKCEECPIRYIGRGGAYCRATPYADWDKVAGPHMDVMTEAQYRAALKELWFLIGIAKKLAEEIERRLNERAD